MSKTLRPKPKLPKKRKRQTKTKNGWETHALSSFQDELRRHERPRQAATTAGAAATDEATQQSDHDRKTNSKGVSTGRNSLDLVKHQHSRAYQSFPRQMLLL